MAADGYLNFDTQINTKGYEKGIESILKAFSALDKSIKELGDVIRSVSDIKITADTSEAEKAAADVSAVVENITEPEIKVGADTSSVEPELEAAVNSVPDAEIDVNADTIAAEQAADHVEAELTALDNAEASPEINPEVSDMDSILTEFRTNMSRIEETAETTSEAMAESFDKAGEAMENSIDDGSNHITDSLDNLKSQFKKLASAAAAVFSAKVLVDFGKQAIESAAEVKAANSQLEQTFRSMLGSAEAAMKRVADASGIVDTRLKGVGTSIYAFAKTSGMDSVQALSMMEDALQVAADSAAYYDRSLEDTSETLKSFLKGNYANDAALGLSATETTRNAAAMKLYGKSFQELSEAQKQLTLLQMVKDANALSGAAGQAARESEGWENVLGNLKETWKQLMAVVGQPLLRGATVVVQQLTSALAFLTEKAQLAVNALSQLFGWEAESSGSTAAVADNIAQSVTNQNDLTNAVEETAEAQNRSLAGFDKMNTLSSGSDTGGSGVSSAPAVIPESSVISAGMEIDTSEASEEIAEFVKDVKGIFKKLQGYLKKNFAPTFNKVWDGLVSETEELYDTVKGIFGDIKSLGLPLALYFKGDFTSLLQSAFAVTGQCLVGLFDTFNTVFSDIWNLAVFPILSDFIILGLPLVTQFVEESVLTFGVFFDEVKSVFDMLWEDVAEPVFTLISDIWHDLMESLQRFWNKWGEPIFQKFREAITLTGETLRNIWNDFLKPVFDKLMQVIDKIWTDHLRPLVDNFLDFVGTLIDGALDIYNEFILPIVNWFTDSFGPPIAAVFGFILETVGNAVGGIIDFVSHVVDTLKGVVDFVTGVFTGDWERAWNGIKDIFTGVWNMLYDNARIPINLIIDLVNGLTSAIESGLNWIIDGLNELSFEVPSWVPGIGGNSFGIDISSIDIPEIPHLAQGTVVPANYGNFLAVLGDNKKETEVVSPLSTIEKAVDRAMKKNGGFGGEIHVHVDLDGREIGRVAVKAVEADKHRKGQ